MLYFVLYATQGTMQVLLQVLCTLIDIQLFHLNQWNMWTLTPNHKYIKIYWQANMT